MATDPLSTEYINSGEWETYISDNEKDENVELQAADITTSDKTTRRRRPPNQTEETKEAWDEESKFLKNAKARETRARKKKMKKKFK
jgi:hypothetical protein